MGYKEPTHSSSKPSSSRTSKSSSRSSARSSARSSSRSSSSNASVNPPASSSSSRSAPRSSSRNLNSISTRNLAQKLGFPPTDGTEDVLRLCEKIGRENVERFRAEYGFDIPTEEPVPDSKWKWSKV